jgi:hypothetical protein
LVPKLVWRLKLVAELRPREVTETEVVRIERDEQASTADLGLRLTETKQLMAALQDQIVPAQVAVVGGRRSSCVSCGRKLASKGYYPVTFRSLFGDVPVRIRRRLTGPCQGQGGAKSFAALDLGNDAIAPELACVTAPVCGAGTVRQGCSATVRAAADEWGVERRHRPKQDAAGGRDRRAATQH